MLIRCYGFFLSCMGRHDEAVAEMQRARDLDPLSPWQNRNLGSALYFSRRYDEAVQHFQEAAELNPNFPVVYNWLSWLNAARQMGGEAALWDLKHQFVTGGDPPAFKIFWNGSVSPNESSKGDNEAGSASRRSDGLPASPTAKYLLIQQ